MDHHIKFQHQQQQQASNVAAPHHPPTAAPSSNVPPPHPHEPPHQQKKDDLHKERPESAYHPGQDVSAETGRQHQVGSLRYGFERLGHMYSLGIPLKFEELQGRHPIDFVEETREHYKLRPDPVKKPAQPEDTTLFDIREWLEPLVRKGQLYWDYCRDKFLDKQSSLGFACAPISCMYSLWSVTDHCLLHGGFVFMAVYLFLTVVFVIPFIYMELTLGQFHRQGLVKAIKQTCPLFQGLAYLMLLSSLFDYLLSMTRVTWLFYYVESVVSNSYPWKKCDQPWYTSQCKSVLDHDDTNVTFSSGERTPAVEWFRIHVSRPWNHLEMVHSNPTALEVIEGLLPNPRIILCFLLIVFLFRLVMRLLVRPLGNIMLWLFYFAFLSLGFTLVGFNQIFPTDIQDSVVQWIFKKDYVVHFLNKGTWTTAIRHAVISSGIGTGIYITLGSHNTFPNDDMKRMSILSGLGSFFFHLIVATFFALCRFTIRTTAAFRNATEDNYGSDLMFEVFPHVSAQHHQDRIGQAMFRYVGYALIILACLRVLCSLHTIRQFFIDRKKEYYEPCRVNYNYWEHDKTKRQQRYINLQLSAQRKGQLMTRIMLCAGVVHLIFFMPGGSFLLIAAEHYWYNYICMFIIMVECLAVFFFAGVRTLNEYVRKMTTWQVTLWYRFMWKVFVPLIPVLYIACPPRPVTTVGGAKVPQVLHLIVYVCAGFPFLFLYVSILQTLRGSRAKSCRNKFLMEVTPEHEHAGMKAGRKPSTRLHWMHHLHVPAGISRGLCLPRYDGALQNPDPSRFNFDNMIMNFLWYGLRLRWFNRLCDGCVNYSTEEDNPSTSFHMFPPLPFPMKPPKKEPPYPEYLPNQAIKRVHKLKKYKDFQKVRKKWLNEKVELERERMAAEHEERDIETGVLMVGAAARLARDEDEEREFFDMFDSTEEEGWDSTSSENSTDSFDISSDDGRGKVSSGSVSTSDSFDSHDSIFWGSGEENSYSRPSRVAAGDSDSTEGEDDDEEDLEGSDADEMLAPAMDYGEDEGVPFDEETDSWDLEPLEDLEEDPGPENPLGLHTSEEETDTDELIEALEDTPEGDSDEEGDSDDEEEDGDEEDDEAKAKEKSSSVAEAKKSADEEKQSEETNSWSLSCGSESTCSSLYDEDDDDSSDDGEEEEEDEKKNKARKSKSRDGSFDDNKSDESIVRRNTPRNMKLKLFRNLAETLETFLHISKKKEKDRIGIIHEQVQKAKKDEKSDKKDDFL